MAGIKYTHNTAKAITKAYNLPSNLSKRGNNPTKRINGTGGRVTPAITVTTAEDYSRVIATLNNPYVVVNGIYTEITQYSGVATIPPESENKNILHAKIRLSANTAPIYTSTITFEFIEKSEYIGKVQTLATVLVGEITWEDGKPIYSQILADPSIDVLFFDCEGAE